MVNNPIDPVEKLYALVEHKLAALIREMEDADWSASDIVPAIQHVLRNRWQSQEEALLQARDSVRDDFVSDGNEG